MTLTDDNNYDNYDNDNENDNDNDKVIYNDINMCDSFALNVTRK